VERFIWKTGLRFESLPIQLGSGATDGQITWAFINALIDYDEEKEKVHIACLDEWEAVKCPVCNKTVGSGVVDPKIIKQYEEEIYRPGEDLSNLTESVEERDRRTELIEFLRANRVEVADRHDESEEEIEEIEELVE
jgi:DNA repair exonuclease SbcCD ATPase subunit